MTRRASVVLLLFLGLLPGCSTYRQTKQASQAAAVENWDAATYHYMEALTLDPTNPRLRMELQRARMRAGEQHFRAGLRFRDANDLQRAEQELSLAVQLDPTQQYAEVELAKVRKELAILAEPGGQTKLEAMKKAASEMKVKPPMLDPRSREPMSLSFPNPTNVKDIYRALGQAFGLNVLFDPRLKDSKITIDLRDVTAIQALEMVMQAAGHFYKVLDPHTVLVIEDTPQNRRDYEDLVVKTFFLSNAEVKDVNNSIRALIDARRLSVNEQLNSLVIRDTADKVAIAERLIAANDKSRAEVLIDVELIQIDATKLRDIGTSLSNGFVFPVTFDPTQINGAGSTSTTIPLTRIGDITRSMWGITVPNIAVSLVKSAGEAETLAQPQLRILEGEKGNLVIGDKVPIPTTTFNTSQTVGGNVVPITAFQYQDVGVKIEVEPRVHHNNEVTLKLQVEVSELGANVQVGQGQYQPEIGTRTISSTIRLKDGETSLLAGLFKYNRSESQAGMPWLSDIPVIGGLFRSNHSEIKKTDLILTLTPHIIRYADITEEDLAPIWVGTENRISLFGNSPKVQSPASSIFAERAGSPGFGGPQDNPTAAEPEEAPAQPEPAPQTFDQRKRLTFPQPPSTKQPTQQAAPDASGGAGSVTSQSVTSDAATTQGGAPAVSSEGGTALPADTRTLTRLTFYPARLPLKLASEGRLQVVLDPGAAGATGPINLAYDRARLRVTHVAGGELGGANGPIKVTVTHTPELGWLTVSWIGLATGSGTLVELTVMPQALGELPVIFAGPIGEIVSRPATVVSLPGDPAAAATEVSQ
jgi:general secretion pathway protein D